MFEGTTALGYWPKTLPLMVIDGFNAIEIDQKGIHRIEGKFKVFGADVEIKKAMIHAFVFDQFALIFFAVHRFGKFGDILVWHDGISFAVH